MNKKVKQIRAANNSALYRIWHGLTAAFMAITIQAQEAKTEEPASQTTEPVVYTWVDENGNRAYSDKLQEGATEAKLAPIQRIDLPKPAPKNELSDTQSTKSKVQAAAAGYRQISWVTPQADAQFSVESAGTVPVAVSLDPPLQPGHEVAFYLGAQQITKLNSPAGTLENVPRGEHELTAKVMANGRVLTQTSSIKIFVQRAKAP
jgi:hypothetical protein